MTRTEMVEKHATGIPGFDVIAEGGLPDGRVTLVAGTAGSAKTVFVTQYLAMGIMRWDERAVFVTFEDSPADLRRHMLSFGWDIARWEEDGRWLFVDASPHGEEPVTEVGSYDLGGLAARIERAIRKSGARRVALDSLNALYARLSDQTVLRAELFRIATMLKELGVTAVFTGERDEQYGPVTRYGVEEFVADNVIMLRHVLLEERRRRTIEILKYRGAAHQNGEFPFTVTSKGITVIPLSALALNQRSSNVRVTSGNRDLDRMCGGGFFRDSIILLSGATGTGKTLSVSQFMAGGVQEGERSLLIAYEESRDQLCRNAKSWGMDFPAMEREGMLRVVTSYPHAIAMEDHLLKIKDAVEDFEPSRIAIDSLSALERVASLRSFREFVINLTGFIKRNEIAGMFTSTTPTISGGESVTEKHISTLTDTILLLRYVELEGQMRRALTVLKMRGSYHDTDIREYTIDGSGMHIGEPFSSISGILSGRLSYLEQGGGEGSAHGAAPDGGPAERSSKHARA